MRGEASAMAGMLPLPCYTVVPYHGMCVPVAARPGCLQKANRYSLADTAFSFLILLYFVIINHKAIYPTVSISFLVNLGDLIRKS